MSEDTGKKYSFRETEPIIREILDELIRNRQFTQTIHNLLANGLGKDIKKAQKQLKQRLAMISKAEQEFEERKGEKK